MVIAWTEMGSMDTSDFVPANTNWQNYDIFTNLSVPKGAVALILMKNEQDAAVNTMGVRTDGSALSRYILLHEAEAGGSVCATMYVTVHATTGLIETYCSTTTGATFYCLGYWTGCTFTERADALSLSAAATSANDVTAYGASAASVCQVLVGNRLDNATNSLGASTANITTRVLLMDEAESASAETTDHECYSLCAKASSGGIVYTYCTSATSTAMLLGYFGTTMDYVEIATPVAGSITVASTWTDFDLTANIATVADRGKQYVAEIFCGHSDATPEHLCGARVNGSAIADRYVLQHEAEGGGYTGSVYPTAMDSGDIVEIYLDQTADERFYFLGYHKPATVANTVTDTLSVASTETVLRHKSPAIATDSGTLTDATPILNKSPLIVTDVFGAMVDVAKADKELKIAEAFGAIVDTPKVSKSPLIVTDTGTITDALITQQTKLVTDTASVASTEAIYLHKSPLIVSDAFGAMVDTPYVHKTLPIADAFSAMVDTPYAHKTIPITDVASLAEFILSHRGIIITDELADVLEVIDVDKEVPPTEVEVTDALSLAEYIYAHKTFFPTDSSTITDTPYVHKGLIMSETGTLTDALSKLDKSLILTDGVSVATLRLSGWSYSKKHTITGSTDSALTDYPIKLTVYYGAGSDSGSSVYCNSNCKPDFSDLRFSNSAGTSLDYWIESYTASTSATVWVEVDSIPKGASTVDIYMYYGNPDAVSASSGANTFTLFDDFDSLDAGVWDSNGTPTASGGALVCDSKDDYVKSKTNYSYGTALRCRANLATGNYNMVMWGNLGGGIDNAPMSNFQYGYPTAGTVNYRNYVTGSAAGNFGLYSGAYYVFEIQRAQDASKTRFTANDANAKELTTQVPTTNSRVMLGNSPSGGNITSTYDWVLVRKYTINEPTSTSWTPASIENVLTHKTLFPTDTITLVESFYRMFPLADALALADYLYNHKTLPMAETASLTEVFLLDKTLYPADAVAASEAPKVDKTLILTDVSTISDEALLDGTFIITDALALSDEQILVLRTIVTEDAVSMSDDVDALKLFIVYDTIDLTCKEAPFWIGWRA